MPLVGYVIIVNNIPRTSREKERTAYDAARFLKTRWPHDDVQIKRPDGVIVTMQADGRTS